MKLINKIGVLGVAALAFSCTDLDVNNSDFLNGVGEYPENEGQAIAAANQVFTRTQGLADWGGWWFLQEVPADAVVAPTRGSDWDDGGKWRSLHTHNWGPTTEAVEQLWRQIYETMTRANKVIEMIEPAAEGNEGLTKLLAQLKVTRAYWYWVAIDNFGDVPMPITFTGADPFPARTPRAQVYDFCVNEILDNIDNLPNAVPGVASSSINKGTAYSILTKLYINAEVYTGTAQWQNAINSADQVLAMGYILEGDVRAPFLTNNAASKENIYTVPYDELNLTGFNLHMRTLFYLNQLTFNMAVQPWNGFAMMEDFYNTFEAEDERNYAFLVGQQYALDGTALIDADADNSPVVLTPNIPALNMSASVYSKAEIRHSGTRNAKYEIKDGARDNLSNDFAIFRLADIMLLKAEAQVRLGGAGAGDAMVNSIRSRAGLTTPGGYTLDAILAERGKELMWEGVRRNDLIRHNKFSQVWWEKNNTDPNRKLFPIPQFALNANPNLTQNLGY